MMPRLSIVLAAAVAIATLAIAAFYLVMPRGPAALTSGEALVGGPFELTSHEGERVSEKTFGGRHMLVYFGYTYCPDVCPSELQVMSAALDQLGDTAEQIQPVFVTIDPARDTRQVMADYVSHFHPRLVGLTGSDEDISRIAKAYRVYYAKASGSDEDDENYLMDHSSIIYLMGPDGEFIKHFTYTTDAEKLAEGIEQALKS